MEETLSSVELRVLGSLIEKQLTTPEYYPLSLNSLVNACNQLSNRDPVVSYDEKTVARALENFREKRLIWMVQVAGNRVPKYEQRLTEALSLSPAEIAVTCVLMLRGPQTPGEIRGRTARLHDFKDLAEVEAALEGLASRQPPLVVRLPRQPGMKESRYTHLLASEVEVRPLEGTPKLESATLEVRAENERITRLEQEVANLRQDLTRLVEQFDAFRKQFE